jgi:hypothetical protein
LTLVFDDGDCALFVVGWLAGAGDCALFVVG